MGQKLECLGTTLEPAGKQTLDADLRLFLEIQIGGRTSGKMTWTVRHHRYWPRSIVTTMTTRPPQPGSERVCFIHLKCSREMMTPKVRP